MATYLLLWNPARWHWADLAETAGRVGRGERITSRWSCGSTRRIASGDRVFLMRLGREPRGIFGSGTVIAAPYEDVHWEMEKARLGQVARYIRFQFDALLDPEREPILWRDRLKSEAPFSEMHWDARSSGVRVPDEVAAAVEQAWSELVGRPLSPVWG